VLAYVCVYIRPRNASRGGPGAFIHSFSVVRRAPAARCRHVFVVCVHWRDRSHGGQVTRHTKATREARGKWIRQASGLVQRAHQQIVLQHVTWEGATPCDALDFRDVDSLGCLCARVA